MVSCQRVDLIPALPISDGKWKRCETSWWSIWHEQLMKATRKKSIPSRFPRFTHCNRPPTARLRTRLTATAFPHSPIMLFSSFSRHRRFFVSLLPCASTLANTLMPLYVLRWICHIYISLARQSHTTAHLLMLLDETECWSMTLEQASNKCTSMLVDFGHGKMWGMRSSFDGLFHPLSIYSRSPSEPIPDKEKSPEVQPKHDKRIQKHTWQIRRSISNSTAF